MIKGIDLTLWKNLLMFTAMVIFVDIAFILTPNISEIWGAKFSDIGKTVQSIKRSLIASKARGKYTQQSFKMSIQQCSVRWNGIRRKNTQKA